MPRFSSSSRFDLSSDWWTALPPSFLEYLKQTVESHLKWLQSWSLTFSPGQGWATNGWLPGSGVFRRLGWAEHFTLETKAGMWSSIPTPGLGCPGAMCNDGRRLVQTWCSLDQLGRAQRSTNRAPLTREALSLSIMCYQMPFSLTMWGGFQYPSERHCERALEPPLTKVWRSHTSSP